jgi:glycosyltransferase involved in cell wall biosynthesis
MLRSADAVTVNSLAGKDYLVNTLGVRDDRVCYVPNIVELSATPRDANPVAPIVGAVGRLVALKRFGAIIDAMTAVRRSVPGARLVIVGDGPARTSLETLARREGVADAVEFTGAVDDAGIQVARFACLVVASTFEGLPNAALEALALGVPVVTVAAGDLPRVVTDGVTGIIARDASPEALADALIRALTSEMLRASAAREGPRLMREEFSAARARDQLLKLYTRLSPGA